MSFKIKIQVVIWSKAECQANIQEHLKIYGKKWNINIEYG